MDRMKQSIKKKYGNENYRNIEKALQTKNKDIHDFCLKNDCSAFSDIFGTRVEHSWETLSYCMEQNSIELLTYKNTLYIRNTDIPVLKTALESIKDVKFSVGEKELFDFIKNLGYTAMANDRTILDGKELDIYVPEKKVAVEFDGLRWHSIQFKSNSHYHLEKTEVCERKGIRLIHIFEDEWITKRPIVESIVRSALGLYNERIYARECTVQEVDMETFRSFCEQNHIQGSCPSSIRLGLFYKGTLVQTAGFSKSRFHKEYEWELVRMCTKLDTQVIGGFSRLMSHFGKDCISYVDRRLFNGKGYESSGFHVIGQNPPSFYYTKGLSRFYRMNFTKKEIARKFPDRYEESLTEEQNMAKLGFYRIYDCGTMKVAYTASRKN